MSFYAKYPTAISVGSGVSTVQGEGTAGTPVGGILTIQGDPAGTPVPISGSISATNPSVGATGAAVPAQATYAGMVVGGNLTGLPGTASGLKVDGSAVTQPVSGTVAVSNFPATQPVSGTVAATQSGTWTVQPGNTANTTAWKVDGSAVTQPISAASLPLPTGAATEASLAKLTLAQGSTTSGQTGALHLGAVTTAAPSYTTAQSSPLSLTTGGALRVDASASTQPVSGTVAVTQSTSPWITAGGGTAGTAASGIVTIQGIAAMTPVATTVSTVAPVTTTTAAFQAEGAVAFGSITNSYVTLFTPTAATKILQMRNNTNAAISVSMDAGSTTNYTLDAGDAVSLDLLANALNMGATAIQVKYAVGAPTSGSFRINGVH